MEIAITRSSTACVLLEIGSVRILMDPVLESGSKTYRLGPAAWSRRYVGPAISPETLAPLDAVLLSHAHHSDNLDDAGKGILREAKQVITGASDVKELSVQAEGLAAWQETTIEGKSGEKIRMTATPVRHGPCWFPHTNRVVGFVLDWEGMEFGVLYISGDTVFFQGIREIAKRCRIRTALLHLGAVHFWPRGRRSSDSRSIVSKRPKRRSSSAPRPSFPFTTNGRSGATSTNRLKATGARSSKQAWQNS
jgi:L-ascorbate metabolism protein UlaG (beta-lactamase superfamily)